MSTTTTASPTPSPTATTTVPPTPGRADVKLTNKGGALPALADFYTWGLQDPRDVGTGSGYDLRAAGVQSFDIGGDQLLVFAVNNWTRWSNAATQEFDVGIAVDRDKLGELQSRFGDQIRDAAEKLLANTVIESFDVRVEES